VFGVCDFEMLFVNDVGRTQWGICRASCGLIPMARSDAIEIHAAQEVFVLQLLCIQVEVYSA
jgi:hypothetical protein